MDNHPIPQDITGFQFKLIGKMTIRQFIYVAVGAIIAWFVFFILELPFMVSLPIAGISLGLGAMIAFVPVDGRPMDTMIRNFVNALISPTQFIYQKNIPPQTENSMTSTHIPQKIQSDPLPTPASAPIQVTPPPVPVNVPEKKDEIQPPTPSVAPSMTFDDPTSMPASFLQKLHEKKEEEKSHEKSQTTDEKEELKKQVQLLQKQLEEKAKQEEALKNAEKIPDVPTPQAPAVNDQNHEEVEKMLAESIRQKEALEKQIIEMQAKQASLGKETFTPITATQQQTTQRVRKVPADMARSVGIPDMPEHPNLVTGIIKDPRGNPLPNILVEVKDMDANPVRAFKTNKLGKFASATSLSNGKYIISFEDPGEKHKFDDVEIELVGSPVMPLEAISVDPREELRRELFN
jgi:hypothetical protein